MLHFFDDAVGAAPKDADRLEIIGVDVKGLIPDGDRRPGVQVPRNGGSRPAQDIKIETLKGATFFGLFFNSVKTAPAVGYFLTRKTAGRLFLVGWPNSIPQPEKRARE